MARIQQVKTTIDDMITIEIPGYDHKYGPDAKPDGGIHNDELIYAVRGELFDGRRVFLSLEIGTGRYPATVPPRSAAPIRPGYDPHMNELALHVQTERGKGVACRLLGEDEKACNVLWDTGLSYMHFDAPEKDPHKYGWAAWPTDVWGPIDKPHPGFWDAMRVKLRVFMRDPTMLAQPDEPADLRAAREALALAEDQQRHTQDAIVRWTKKRDARISEYLARRGS